MDVLSIVSIVVITVMIGNLLVFLSSQDAPKGKVQRLLRVLQKIGLLCFFLSIISIGVMLYSISYHDHAMLTGMILLPLGILLTGFSCYFESKMENK